jgi:hypothetical protein
MNHDRGRVLTQGTPELSKEEAKAVRGCLFIHTNVCTSAPLPAAWMAMVVGTKRKRYSSFVVQRLRGCFQPGAERQSASGITVTPNQRRKQNGS